LASLYRKQPPITNPKTSKQMTLTEFHGKITPPNSSPNKRVSVTPTIVTLPIQSTALSPANIGVDGESKCKNKDKNIKARAEQGTIRPY
jgi:hypothetical protein